MTVLQEYTIHSGCTSQAFILNPLKFKISELISSTVNQKGLAYNSFLSELKQEVKKTGAEIITVSSGNTSASKEFLESIGVDLANSDDGLLFVKDFFAQFPGQNENDQEIRVLLFIDNIEKAVKSILNIEENCRKCSIKLIIISFETEVKAKLNEQSYKNKGKSWSDAEDELLVSLVKQGKTIEEIISELERNSGGICARIASKVKDNTISKQFARDVLMNQPLFVEWYNKYGGSYF